jgi:hypothetical protein
MVQQRTNEPAVGARSHFVGVQLRHAISEPCECSRIRSGHAVAESILTTAGKPVGLRLTAYRKVLRADGQDLSFVTIEAVDAGRRLRQWGTEMVKTLRPTRETTANSIRGARWS